MFIHRKTEAELSLNAARREICMTHPPRLLDQARNLIRTRHYSIRTEDTYTGWIKRFTLLHGKRHPKDMEKKEIEEFLTDLAVNRNAPHPPRTKRLMHCCFFTGKCWA